MTSSTTFRSLLERYMAQGTGRNISELPLAEGIDNLEEAGEYLLSLGHHGWVRRRVSDLTDTANWPAYMLEVLFIRELEMAGFQVQNSERRVPSDNSDLDIVYRHSNGIEVRAECVSMAEPDDYWQDDIEVEPGIIFKSALYGATGEANLLRRVQSKIRLKTIRKDDRPTKFPPADTGSVQIIIADVTEAPGYRPDRWDLELLAWGNNAVGPTEQRPLLGLFEANNPYSPQFDGEFLANQYLRERIHAIMFLIDKSEYRRPLIPQYTGVFLENPYLLMDSQQLEALTYGSQLKNLIPSWWVEQRWQFSE
jgi:hypothetical protein